MSQTGLNTFAWNDRYVSGGGPFSGLHGLDMLKMILLYTCGILSVLLIIFFIIGWISAASISSRITSLEQKYGKQ